LPTNSSQAPEQASFEDVRPSGAPVSLSINMGTLIHLPGAAKTVFVANPDIADVNKHDATPDLIYLFAKKGGSTVLYAVDASGHLLLNKVIHVEPGPVAIIRRGTIETGEPAPVQNNLVLSLQPAVAPQPAAPASP
jgi:Flp pilus assembly secretin CpaC